MIYLVDFWTLIFNNFVDLKAIQKKCDKKISPIKGDGKIKFYSGIKMLLNGRMIKLRDVVYVENRYYVSVKKNSFRFFDLLNKKEKFIPFEDVGFLVFENKNSFFSKRMIDVCLKEDIEIIFCDSKHSPIAVISSIYGQNQRLKKLKNQLAFSSKSKKRTWRKLVIAKINNQADCLIQVANQVDSGKNLKLVGKQVEDGDPQNKEAYAARRYFVALYGGNFKRGRFDDIINSGLNYGYAILRSVIRQQLIIHGLEPSWGVHHISTENPFNLSDDLIEPFRPYVDILVYENLYKKGIYSLKTENKKDLLQVLFSRCVIDGKVYTLADAIAVEVNSYVSCIEKQSASPLKLPIFIEGGI